LPKTIPKRDKDLVRMLRAVDHVNPYSSTDTKRGRSSRWKREELLLVGSKLSSILERETFSDLGVSSFIAHYLRVVDCSLSVVPDSVERETCRKLAESLRLFG
jgi:hypothetical protein